MPGLSRSSHLSLQLPLHGLGGRRLTLSRTLRVVAHALRYRLTYADARGSCHRTPQSSSLHDASGGSMLAFNLSRCRSALALWAEGLYRRDAWRSRLLSRGLFELPPPINPRFHVVVGGVALLISVTLTLWYVLPHWWGVALGVVLGSIFAPAPLFITWPRATFDVTDIDARDVAIGSVVGVAPPFASVARPSPEQEKQLKWGVVVVATFEYHGRTESRRFGLANGWAVSAAPDDKMEVAVPSDGFRQYRPSREPFDYPLLPDEEGEAALFSVWNMHVDGLEAVTAIEIREDSDEWDLGRLESTLEQLVDLRLLSAARRSFRQTTMEYQLTAAGTITVAQCARSRGTEVYNDARELTMPQATPANENPRQPLGAPLRVLYLVANPKMDLRTEAEVRAVQQAVRRALHRDLIDIQYRPAATPDDLLDGLNDIRPHVVHFSGHAGGSAVLFDDASVAAPGGRSITLKLLADALAATASPPDVVVLDGCDTLDGAEPLLLAASVVIGMASSVSDLAASAFAAKFYAAVASAQPVGAALRQGAVALNFIESQEGWKPGLLARNDIDVDKMVLVEPPQA